MTKTATQQENVALVRTTIEAYNSGEVQLIVHQVHPEIEVYTGPSLINEGTYWGPDGLLQWLEQWNEAWDEFQLSIEKLEPIGERHVVADIRQTGRGRGSGVEIEGNVAHVYEFEDGICTRFHLYADGDQARAAAERLAAGGPFQGPDPHAG
jgi:hypothetical protein